MLHARDLSRRRAFSLPLTPHPLPLTLRGGIALADQPIAEAAYMTHSQWMIAGAVMLGIAVLVYLVFFCPAECH
jgi:hypothetical protein